MHVTDISRGRTVIRVVIALPDPSDRPVSDDLLKGYAMHAAREEPGSLFGTRVERSEDGLRAYVDLYTD